MTHQKVDQKEVYDEEERRRREQEKEKQEEKKKKAKPGSKPIAKEKIALPEKVKIPIVELDELAIELKEIEIDKEIPEITKEEVKITIPIVELEKPAIELKQIELDYTLPDIIPEEKKLEVPLIRLEKAKKVTCIITTFDERLPQVKVTKRMLKIPIYRPSKPIIREIISSFDSRLDVKILQRLIIEEEKEEVIEEKQTAEVISPAGEPPGGEEESEEVPDIIDFVFGVPNGKISSKRPKIVLYKELENDSTIGSFETLCIRIYREKEGGDPRIQPIKKLDEFNIKEIEKWMEANKRIVTVDLDHDKEKANKWFCEENLREPLRRAIIGEVGFIIFKTRDEKSYKYCTKVLENLKKEIEHPLDVVYVQPRSLSFEEKKKLSRLVWGNVGLDDLAPILIEEEKVERPYGDTIDDIFNKLSKDLFEKRLEAVEREDGGIYVYATNQHEGEESSEHYLMKCFIVKLLSKERKLRDVVKIKEMIKTEEEYEGVIPDIRVNNSVYEVETLFSEDREGKIPKKKIENTITKYENTSIREINIVLDNLTFLRHLEDLIEINRVLKEWARTHGKIIRFYTLDIENGKLLPLGEVIKEIKSLYTSASS